MIKLCSALLSLLLLGCAGPRADHRVTTSNDPWMAAGVDYESGPSRPVPPADFAVVPAAGRGEAVSMLAEREWVELPADSPLIPDDFPAGGGAIYLVRGLVLQGREGSGTYFVSLYDSGTLRVGFGCLGGSPAPTARTPLVVRLSHAPSRVVTSVSMAQ